MVVQIWRTTRSSPGTSHESEASEASVFCFDNASPEKSCFVDGLVCFISLCLLVLEQLQNTRPLLLHVSVCSEERRI